MSCRFVPPSAVPFVPLGAFATTVVGVLGFMDGEVEEVLVALAYRQQYSELVTSMQANSMSCQYLAILHHDLACRHHLVGNHHNYCHVQTTPHGLVMKLQCKK